MSLLSFLVVDVEKIMHMVSMIPDVAVDNQKISTAATDGAASNIDHGEMSQHESADALYDVLRTIQGWLMLTLPTLQYFSLNSESVDFISHLSSSNIFL